MELTNQILNHDLYKEYYEMIQSMETNRVYCKHGIEHFLDTARIAYILNLEEQHGISKDIIYATALLHDIGKGLQYREGIPHHLGSVEISTKILKECYLEEKITHDIISAIKSHRKEKALEKGVLNSLIYRADKLSRQCYLCQQEKNCHWSDDLKNMGIKV